MALLRGKATHLLHSGHSKLMLRMLDARIKALQDDKGGEYMSKEHRQQPVPQPASPPLALRRPRRNVQPPREWWVVQHEPVPAESSDEEQDQPEPELGSDLEPDVEPEPIDPGFETVQFAGTAGPADPRTYKQAMQSDDADDWKAAVDSEYTSLLSNGTWEECDLPEGLLAG
ncbi:hypothetical protein H0H93_013470, partial [Arthromyces matolae]